MFDKDYNHIPKEVLKQHWSQTSFSYLKTPRPDYGIMLVLNGQINFSSPGTDTLYAKAGNIIFLPKNSYYEAIFRIELGNIDNYLVNFESNENFKCSKPMMISESASFECYDMFRQLFEEMGNVERTDLRIKGFFYLLLDSVINENKASESPHDMIFEKAKKLLKDEDISINQVASECSVSESGLRKIFSDKIGISPTQYKLKEKFNQAQYLLEATDMSVGEISVKLNFYDVAYFCKLFRERTGLTPKQYRQNKKL